MLSVSAFATTPLKYEATNTALKFCFPFHHEPLQSGHREYLGHASFVCNVRFSPQCSTVQRVITAGGRDRSIFQYRVVEVVWPGEKYSTRLNTFAKLTVTGV